MIADREKTKHRGLVLLHLLSDFQSWLNLRISRLRERNFFRR
jgi:hypothetical protein